MTTHSGMLFLDADYCRNGRETVGWDSANAGLIGCSLSEDDGPTYWGSTAVVALF